MVIQLQKDRAKWILYIAVYKNNNLVKKSMVITDGVSDKHNAYIKKLHLIFDNKPSKYDKETPFKLQMVNKEAIDENIIKSIEWRKYVTIGSQICYHNAFSNYFNNCFDIIGIDPEDEDILIIERVRTHFYREEPKKRLRIQRYCCKMSQPHYEPSGEVELGRSLFAVSFQFVVIL